MAQFLEITLIDGEKRILNADEIIEIIPKKQDSTNRTETKTKIEVGNGCLLVKESYEDLKNLLGADFVGMEHKPPYSEEFV